MPWEGAGGRALAKALRLNTMLTSFDLGINGLGEGGRWQRHCVCVCVCVCVYTYKDLV